MNFYSQAGQDRFLFENFFRGKRGGRFVDVGAYDGEKFSNSLFFERFMGWLGLCVEPLPAAYQRLVAGRQCICEQVCVADFEGEATLLESDCGIDEKMLSGLSVNFDRRHVERVNRHATNRVERVVAVKKLSSLLEKYGLFSIDFCSIDTQGSELGIIEELDLKRFKVGVFTIENSYDDPRVGEVMERKGYEFVVKLERDYIFKRRDLRRLPRTTVICAVWHGDRAREELLKGHSQNLRAQTVAVDAIYVFDGSGRPPDWLPGHKIVAQEALTIYQAWNLALALVETPLVMNLNLDDRLAPDAVERLEAALLEARATIAAGDWRICYSQEATDAVMPCYPADTLPFVGDWPPTTGTETRLGSGTGHRGTLGPATLWRMDAHIGAPRYPWRLADGTMLKVVGDAAWWAVIQHHFKKQAVRLPMVIGNYYSHPSTQAEFRGSPEEWTMVNQLGVSPL
jgi:FkbM family methyltransferase